MGCVTPTPMEGSRLPLTRSSLATSKTDADKKSRLNPEKYPENFAG